MRVRVTLLAAGAFAVALAVATFTLLRALEQTLVDDVRDANESVLAAQAMRVLASGVPAGADILTTPAAAAFELPLTGPRQVVMFSDDPARLDDLPPARLDAVRAAAGAVPGDFVYTASVPAGADTLLGIAGQTDRFAVSSLSVGGVTLATAASLDDVSDTIATTRTLFWFVGPALVALVAGLAWLLAGRALRPVHAVTSRVASIGSHSLHERVPVPASSDEIAELARTMNGMLARLERATTASRRLVSDASHELRTPVTVMRTELEVARRTPGNEWDATGAVLEEELDRLQGLVDDLLLLARGDERSLAAADVDVVDLAQEAAARRRAVPVDVAAERPAVVRSDPGALRRAIDHLVANAARHATSRVLVTVTTDGGLGVVHVDDDGPGIPPSARARAVERFVRLDEGRARDAGGAGLGLAIASEVAAGQGGGLELGDGPLGGARVTLRLPSVLSFGHGPIGPSPNDRTG